MNFSAVQKLFPQKITDFSAGFQHSLFLAEDGACYGTGRTNWKQFQPYIGEEKKESVPRNYLESNPEILVDYYPKLQKILFPGEKIIKVAAGFSHSLFLTSKNKLY